MYEGLVRYVNSLPGTNPGAIKILLTAPTAKVAHGIHGMTLHCAFALPVTEFNGPMPNSSFDVCNTLRSKLLSLNVIIIDEISMIGSKIISQVYSRLKEIMDTSLDFGGVSIICVGDFQQQAIITSNSWRSAITSGYPSLIAFSLLMYLLVVAIYSSLPPMSLTWSYPLGLRPCKPASVLTDNSTD